MIKNIVNVKSLKNIFYSFRGEYICDSNKNLLLSLNFKITCENMTLPVNRSDLTNVLSNDLLSTQEYIQIILIKNFEVFFKYSIERSSRSAK